MESLMTSPSVTTCGNSKRSLSSYLCAHLTSANGVPTHQIHLELTQGAVLLSELTQGAVLLSDFHWRKIYGLNMCYKNNYVVTPLFISHNECVRIDLVVLWCLFFWFPVIIYFLKHHWLFLIFRATEQQLSQTTTTKTNKAMDNHFTPSVLVKCWTENVSLRCLSFHSTWFR